MVASLIASMLALSLISDWIKRRNVDLVEGAMLQIKHWAQWGTVWPCDARFEADYSRPQYAFRYFMVRLPGWYWEQCPWRDPRRAPFQWHRHYLHKSHGRPWEVFSIASD